MVSVFQPKRAVQVAQSSELDISSPITEVWRTACEALNGRKASTDALIDGHEVGIALRNDANRGVWTDYRVHVGTCLAPDFTLVKGSIANNAAPIDTGDSRFDNMVAIDTDSPAALVEFLTAERRLAILQLLMQEPTARVTNTSISARSKGVQRLSSKVGLTMQRLVDVADVMPPSWVNVALDERSVLKDLFDSGRDAEGVAERFDTLYWGNEVTWTGQVVQVGSVDAVGRRVAVYIGTADGQNAASGRVIALTAVDPEMVVEEGDVVKITGGLWNLDPTKRFFRIE